jgi:hypothetical protein
VGELNFSFHLSRHSCIILQNSMIFFPCILYIYIIWSKNYIA